MIAAVPAHTAVRRDAYGGWIELQGQKTGFFHTEQIQGVWWLITPDGHAFLTKGVNHISYMGDHSPALKYSPYGRQVAAHFGSADKWAQATAQRLQAWGFNTVGAWSSPEMAQQRLPYTPVLNLATSAGANWLDGQVADVFAPEFAKGVQEQARNVCAPLAADPFLLGYFTDNELRWSADWRSKKSLFQDFITQPGDGPGRQTAVRLVRDRWASLEEFNRAWGTQLSDWNELRSLPSEAFTREAAKAVQREFLKAYARAYFKTCRDAIQTVDRNHLVLGCRFAGYAPEPVIEAMGEFVDLVSYNHYGTQPPVEELRKLHRLTGRPIALTEFSFKAQDSGLPNTRGAGKPVATQQDRADLFEGYVTGLLRLPFMVGFHWFEYADEPAEGRFDGENSNYGVVNIQDEPWSLLVERMTVVNSGLETLHQTTGAGQKQ